MTMPHAATSGPSDPAADAREALHALEVAVRSGAILRLPTAGAEASLAAVRRRLGPLEGDATIDAGAAAWAMQMAIAAVEPLAAAAGLRDRRIRDLLRESARRKAVDRAVAELALLLDMEGLERHAVEATRASARRLGAGPVRLLRAAGGPAATTPAATTPAAAEAFGDPGGHLRAWRSRGQLSPISHLVRRAIDAGAAEMPPGLREPYAEATEPTELEERLAAALDRQIDRERPETDAVPRHPAWRALGVAQWLNSVVLVGAAAWLGASLGSGAATPATRLPLLGDVPMPVFLLGLSLVIGYWLARQLRIHSLRVGRRWGHRLEVVMRIGARTVVEAEAFARVDRLEGARRQLGEVVLGLRERQAG